jgi:hypothetical protein
LGTPGSYAVSLEGGWATGRTRLDKDTSFGRSDELDTSPGLGSASLDARFFIPMNSSFALVAGGKITTFLGDRAATLEEDDHPTPGNDTFLTYERNGSALVYGGITIPLMQSAASAAFASAKPARAARSANAQAIVSPADRGSSVFITLYAGARFEWGRLTLTTNESGGGGVINTFSKNVSGWAPTIGADVDVLLAPWSGIAAQPFLRAGVALDFPVTATIDGRSTLGFGYHGAIGGTVPSVTGKIGTGLRF